MLQSVHSAVKDLADFTDMLSGEDRVTLSSLRAVLHILRNKVLVESYVDTTLTKDIKGVFLLIWKESILMLKHLR